MTSRCAIPNRAEADARASLLALTQEVPHG